MIEFDLKALLEKHNVTPYRLQEHLGSKVGPDTVYRWVRKPPKKLDLEVAEIVIRGVSELVGKHIDPADVFKRR